ncbi:MAG: nicotinate (nicotinamide) nucleotide adenylyltransferase [Ruminococcaceae bacterium]|nr:nicotinate (nicotinamide) nucleotide adenylyltransferase [Oscillospiraceae bacterium]
MKILLFGGAFDPPHKGHVSVLQKAAQYMDFDKIIVMPTGTPTHKKNCVAPFDVRFYMAKQAFESIGENVEISDYEGTNLKDDYTYLTLEYLKEKYNNPHIYMAIGSDSLFALDSWKNSGQIMKNCTVLAFAREDDIGRDMQQKTEELEKLGAEIEFVKTQPIEFSSSQYRKGFGEEGEEFLPKAVQDTIDEYDIYAQDDITRWKGTAKLAAKLLLDEKRYIHTLNVEKLAAELGTIHSLDVEKLRVAALLHDVMKNAPYDILLHRAGQSGIINRIEDKPRQTLHGFAAADYAEKELGIEDKDILWAVRSHTCGRKGMQDMEKVIYLADMLCEERKFESKEYLLSIAKQNLNDAMLAALQCSIEWIKSKGNIIDTDSLSALEYFEKLLGQ